MGRLEPGTLEWLIWAAGVSGGCLSVYCVVQLRGWDRVRAADTGRVTGGPLGDHDLGEARMSVKLSR